MATLNREAVETALDNWAEHIAANRPVDGGELAIVGVISHGDVLAQRLICRLEARGIQARYGALDISLYRDDFDMKQSKPALRSSYLPFSTDGLHLILVDDVLISKKIASYVWIVLSHFLLCLDFSILSKGHRHCETDQYSCYQSQQELYRATIL